MITITALKNIGRDDELYLTYGSLITSPNTKSNSQSVDI